MVRYAEAVYGTRDGVQRIFNYSPEYHGTLEEYRWQRSSLSWGVKIRLLQLSSQPIIIASTPFSSYHNHAEEYFNISLHGTFEARSEESLTLSIELWARRGTVITLQHNGYGEFGVTTPGSWLLEVGRPSDSDKVLRAPDNL